MIEIIPNWHPIFVHLTVGLFSAAVAFYLLFYLASRSQFFLNKIIDEFGIVARWCLWMSGLVVIPTVLAGLYAYNTVNHDVVSHAAMTNHLNVALPTAGAIIIVTLWSLWSYRRKRPLTIVFVISLLIVQMMLIFTGWRGAELVFRYGVGVMSLPATNDTEHHHNELEHQSNHSH